MTNTLTATCSVDFPTCSTLMSDLATALVSTSNCGADYKAQNPLVEQAYDGFLSYVPLYQAGCLKDPSTGNYCFANAITNTTSPTDSYIYYLPLGITFPGGSTPTCDSCLQQTMQVFQTTAGNATQPVSSDYVSAATQIDEGCGPGFVNATVPMTKKGSAAAARNASRAGSMATVIAAAAALLLLCGL